MPMTCTAPYSSAHGPTRAEFEELVPLRPLQCLTSAQPAGSFLATRTAPCGVRAATCWGKKTPGAAAASVVRARPPVHVSHTELLFNHQRPGAPSQRNIAFVL